MIPIYEKRLEQSMAILDALRENVTEVVANGDVQWGLVNFQKARPLGLSDYEYRSALQTLSANGFVKGTQNRVRESLDIKRSGWVRFAS